MEQENRINAEELKMRRNHDFLWISSEKKKIYLKSTEGCLMLFFQNMEEMVKYVVSLSRKGFTVG